MTISEQKRLQAMAVLMMAIQHRQKAREFELAALELLGLQDGDHVSEFVWSDFAAFDVDTFDKVLQREGIVIDCEQTS